jgi:hypothetical protein
MARGASLELRCGRCHSGPIFPTDRRARAELLGEIYVSPCRSWMTWSGHYADEAEQWRNRLPNPRQVGNGGSGTTWRPVPRDGVRHTCGPAGHAIALTEKELWGLVRALPDGASVLLLPATEPRQLQTSTPSTSGATANVAGLRAATGP